MSILAVREGGSLDGQAGQQMVLLGARSLHPLSVSSSDPHGLALSVFSWGQV